jgi:hypothetical protein
VCVCVCVCVCVFLFVYTQLSVQFSVPLPMCALTRSDSFVCCAVSIPLEFTTSVHRNQEPCKNCRLLILNGGE